jgi:hypothetical protein
MVQIGAALYRGKGFASLHAAGSEPSACRCDNAAHGAR